MSFSIVKTEGSIAIKWEGDYELNMKNIARFYKITPFDFYSILNEYGFCRENTTYYLFDNYITAATAIEKLESRLVMNKLVE